MVDVEDLVVGCIPGRYSVDKNFSLDGLLFELVRVGCCWLVRLWLGVAEFYIYQLTAPLNFQAVAACMNSRADQSAYLI